MAISKKRLVDAAAGAFVAGIVTGAVAYNAGANNGFENGVDAGIKQSMVCAYELSRMASLADIKNNEERFSQNELAALQTIWDHYNDRKSRNGNCSDIPLEIDHSGPESKLKVQEYYLGEGDEPYLGQYYLGNEHLHR